MQVEKRLRVAICGAGIGGLNCALALSRYPDIEVDIYESASKLAEVGAGIGIWPRPWEIIRKLGLEQDLLKTVDTRPTDERVIALEYRKSDIPEGKSFYKLITKGHLLTFHRADFQQALLRKIAKTCDIHYAKRFQTYSELSSNKIELLFEDGSRAFCDVLVGADGVKSVVRRTFLEAEARLVGSNEKEVDEIMGCINPTWSGQVAYRAVIATENLRAQAPDHNAITRATKYLGKDAYVIAYPISHGKLINIVAFILRHDLENTPYSDPWVAKSNKDEILSHFSGWEQEVKDLIHCIDSPSKWAIHCVRPLRSYVAERVALLGDAAHAMTPHQGSGAGQAIEDAFVLSTLLGNPHTTRETLSRVLRIYDETRRPFSQDIARRSMLNSRYFSLNVPGVDFAGPDLEEKLQELGEVITENWEWAWLSSVEEFIEAAIDKLVKSVG